MNGFYLNPSEYGVEEKEVVLTRSLDVVGSVVELVVTRAIGITEEDYDDLRGYSAYEVAVRNGFEGSEEAWLRSLAGSGGYKKMTKYYRTTSERESRFALPYSYTRLCMLDVFVNGFKLNEEEYQIEEKDSRYFVVLSKALDVLGSVVEMDVIDANTVNVATIDGFLSDESENPVQNKVIKKALDGLRIDLGNVEVLLGEV